MKYRKTALVDAVEWTGTNLQEMADFLGDDYIGIDGTTLLVHTLEGVLRFTSGYMVVRNPGGEHYGCAADVWAATYEPVENDRSQP